jgi:Fur family ferric uptake transcriptional regulator
MPTPSSEITRRLQEHEVRYTTGRQTLIDALARAEGPRSAAELQDEVRLPLSSIYRSLTVLEDAGVVEPHLGQRGVTRYELAEWLRGHHHHLVCVACGTVDDIELPDSYETKVAELVDDIGSISGFAPLSHALEIEGRCVKCR